MREPWPSEHAGKRSIGTPASAGMLIGFTLRACPPRPDERRDHLSPWQASISETCAPCPQYKLAPTRPGRNQPFVRPLRSLLSSPIEVELNLNFSLSFFVLRGTLPLPLLLHPLAQCTHITFSPVDHLL